MTKSTSQAAKSLQALTSAALLCLCAVGASSTHAAGLLVWSAGAAQAPMTELVQTYQSRSGHSVTMEFAPVGTLLKRLSDGGKPDVLILSQDVGAEVERSGWTTPGSSTPLASVGVGVAVRQGAALPDISSADALRATLLNAKSITYVDPTKGTSGKHFASVLQQLGIAEQMQAKTRLGESGFVVEPVAHGEVEIGIQQITEILPVQGAVLVGPLPPALQKITTYTIAPTRSAREPAAAKEFIEFIVQEPSRAVFRAKGFTVP